MNVDYEQCFKWLTWSYTQKMPDGSTAAFKHVLHTVEGGHDAVCIQVITYPTNKPPTRSAYIEGTGTTAEQAIVDALPIWSKLVASIEHNKNMFTAH